MDIRTGAGTFEFLLALIVRRAHFSAALCRKDTVQLQGEVMSLFSRALRRVLFVLFLASTPLAAFAGFSIANGQLVDGNGVPFVMRGVAYPYTWYSWRGEATVQQDIANIAATKANTVRYVLSTGGQWARIPGAQVTQVIEWAKARQMISVLEVHDSTGWSEGSGSVHISNAVSYWTSADIRAAINGQENFAIINIANEPFGNNTTANYVADTIAAIQALRAAGITHTLMIDAANWGQDWSNTMRTNAMQLWNADPLRNLVFSVHMYEVYGQASTITSYMQAFDDMGLPLVIGEFGLQHNGQDVDEATIMAQAQQRGNGYIAWSWSGNGGCCTFLDMVTEFGTTLTPWGQIVVNGANGIAATSVPATVFGATNNLALSTSSVSLVSAASSSPVSVTANVSWTVTDNQSWLSVTPTSGSNNGSFTISATANTGTAARTGTVTVTGGSLTRTVSVTQAAATANTLTLSASSLSLASAASSSPVNVTANVSWTVTDNQTWLSASPTSGSNNGSFTVSATANTGTAARTGTVTVTGGGLTRTISVTQAAPSANNLSLSASSLSLASGAASSAVNVTANVSWTVTDDQSWLSASPASGSNNGSFTVSATANGGTTARTGTVTVTGGGLTRTIAVSQAGQTGSGGCSNPVTFSGNSGNFNTTGGVCYRTNANINGWGCYNFDGRTLTVGGVARSCGQMPLTRSADGYYYFEVSAGQYPWAGLYTW
jgi:mannan endo-1,4-beta-mannosidase